ncbi:hypothetical protein [Peribacillus sp. SCS-37]|uniref:hypothetical protein n=1 Tax=Paraperibacillus esterisolvens TaxID=3115296 RepID=UPI003905F50E
MHMQMGDCIARNLGKYIKPLHSFNARLILDIAIPKAADSFRHITKRRSMTFKVQS